MQSSWAWQHLFNISVFSKYSYFHFRKSHLGQVERINRACNTEVQAYAVLLFSHRLWSQKHKSGHLSRFNFPTSKDFHSCVSVFSITGSLKNPTLHLIHRSSTQTILHLVHTSVSLKHLKPLSMSMGKSSEQGGSVVVSISSSSFLDF